MHFLTLPASPSRLENALKNNPKHSKSPVLQIPPRASDPSLSAPSSSISTKYHSNTNSIFSETSLPMTASPVTSDATSSWITILKHDLWLLKCHEEQGDLSRSGLLQPSFRAGPRLPTERWAWDFRRSRTVRVCFVCLGLWSQTNWMIYALNRGIVVNLVLRLKSAMQVCVPTWALKKPDIYCLGPPNIPALWVL